MISSTGSVCEKGQYVRRIDPPRLNFNAKTKKYTEEWSPYFSHNITFITVFSDWPIITMSHTDTNMMTNFQYGSHNVSRDGFMLVSTVGDNQDYIRETKFLYIKWKACV